MRFIKALAAGAFALAALTASASAFAVRPVAASPLSSASSLDSTTQRAAAY